MDQEEKWNFISQKTLQRVETADHPLDTQQSEKMNTKEFEK